MTDNVNAPAHYTAGGIECIEALQAMAGDEAHTDHCIQTAMAYLWRWRHKNGLEDLRKAQWYLTRAINVQTTTPTT